MSSTKTLPSYRRTMCRSEVCAVIPAFNEASSIAGVVRELLSLGIPTIVVDDGSEDNTAAIAEASGAEVIRLPQNRGKGASIRCGLAAAKERFEYAVLLDADGQHSPQDALRLLLHIKKTDVDILIGNRMHSPKKMPLIRRLTNRLMTTVLRILTGLNIPDTQCGLKAIRLDRFEPTDFKCDRFDWESELIVRARQKNLRILSTPIDCIYTTHPSSKINAVPDTLRFIWLILRNILHG